jgi:hypothetical protein
MARADNFNGWRGRGVHFFRTIFNAHRKAKRACGRLSSSFRVVGNYSRRVELGGGKYCEICLE